MVKKDSETTAFKINLEAATIISKQLKLRNISGIIIIDFINMQQTTHQENLLKQLRSLVKQDKTPTNVIDITSLGLVEMTRKRVYATLKEQLKLFNLN